MLKKSFNFFAFTLIILCVFSLTAKGEIVDQSGLLDGYHTVYELSIPKSPSYNGTAPAYSVDNTASLAATNRVVEKIGYYFSLTSSSTGNTEWIGVTMDAFTDNYTQMGVPTFSSGAIFQQYVTNMTYKSNAATLNNETYNAAAGVSVKKGNIEFWPTNYSQGNAIGITNASNDLYDFGDSRTAGGTYGSMQIHDFQNKTVLMAFNNWNGGANCMGIGNYPNASTTSSGGQKDWTFVDTANTYSDRQLGVYVKYLFDDVQTSQRDAVEADAAGMVRVYQYDVTKGGRTPTTDFTINTTSLTGMPLDRVAYYYRLEKPDGSIDYAYVSYDALNETSRTKLGIPNNNNFMYQTGVNNMTVWSNVDGVVNGTNLTGNVEIWSTNYDKANAANVPGANAGAYDFGDIKSDGGEYGSFQIHNTTAKQTVIAYNRQYDTNPDVGIGNRPSVADTDWTFAQNASSYKSVTLDVLASAAIAPKMAEATNGADYTVVQGARISQQMTTNWHDNFKYDIVNNAADMSSNGVMFDRVGYYIEYAPTYDSELHYAFVSMDAFTDDVTKIGVPNAESGIFWQQKVKNLEVSTNVPASEGILTAGSFNMDIVAVFLHGGEIPDFLQAGFPGFAGGHAAIHGNGAGIGHRAAAGRGEINLGDGAGTPAEEAGILIMLGVVLRVQHFHEALDGGAFGAAVVIQGPDILQDIGHFKNRVIAALRSAAVAGDALHVHADFHTAPMTAVDAAVGGLGGDDELRTDAVLVDDILPAHAVAVFLLNGADDHELIAPGNQAQVLHDLRAVHRAGHTALLVGAAAAVNDFVGFIAFIGIRGPVIPVSDADGIDMGIDGDDFLALPHPADDIAEAVHFHLVKTQFFHFRPDAGHDLFFLAAFAGERNHRPQETDHVRLVTLGGFFDCFNIQCHTFRPPFFFRILLNPLTYTSANDRHEDPSFHSG